MKNPYIKYLHPLIVSILMTLIMSFTGLYLNKGFDEQFASNWFRSFIFMLPIAYLASFFIIPFSSLLLDNFFSNRKK